MPSRIASAARAASTPPAAPRQWPCIDFVDETIVRALKLALGEDVAARTPVSSTKSMHGHCLGAAGGVEGALTALAVKEGRIPPTINLDDLDPECAGVDHVANVARDADIRVAVSNAFGFGGHNAILVLGRMGER